MTCSLERYPFEETGNHNDGEEILLHWSPRVNWSAHKWSALDHNLPTWIHPTPSHIYSRLFSIVILISNLCIGLPSYLFTSRFSDWNITNSDICHLPSCVLSSSHLSLPYPTNSARCESY